MASYHHHHRCHNHVPAPTTTTTCSCCSYSQCCSQPHRPSPPPLNQSPTDPLLHALASLLQQQQEQQQEQQQQQQLQPLHLYTPHVAKPSTEKTHYQNLRFQQHQQTQFVLSSLTQRISALESSIQQLSTSSPTNGHYREYALRDTAARVIQTHFRAFLVRRSRTLSHLKHLAFIRSSFNSLKSSISNKTYFEPKVVSRKVTDLVLKLDSIQSGDPMIRDGKRSISRDLTRFLDFIDGIAVKKHMTSNQNGRNMRFVANTSNESRALNDNYSYGDLSANQMEVVEKLRDRVERISGFSRVCGNNQIDAELEGFQQVIDDDEKEGINLKVCIDEKNGFSNTRNGIPVKTNSAQSKRSVSFAEKGNVYTIPRNTPEWEIHKDATITDESESSDDNGEVVENRFDEIGGRKRISLATGSEEKTPLEDESHWW